MKNIINIKSTAGQLESDDVVKPLCFVNSKIVLTTDSPKNSIVYAKIVGFKKEYYVPLFLEQQANDGNVFSCRVMFLNEHRTFMLQNPTKTYKLYFIINDVEQDGFVTFSIIPQQVYNYDIQSSILKPVLDELTNIKSDLYQLKKEYPTFSKSQTDLNKGMVPVATGTNNDYVWDYPFDKYNQRLKKLSSVILELTEEYETLVNKVNNIQEILTDHIYEEYQL